MNKYFVIYYYINGINNIKFYINYHFQKFISKRI